MKSKDIPVDPYELLGVSPGASLEEIKKAFRRESLRWHPDRPNGNAERFRALVDAMETLTADGGNSTSGTPSPNPYLTPNQITWILDGTHPPEPATVRLSHRGDVANVEVDPQNGAFWAITTSVSVMEGSDLYDFVIAPVDIKTVDSGIYGDEVCFFVDAQVVKLTICLIVIQKPPEVAELSVTPDQVVWELTELTNSLDPVSVSVSSSSAGAVGVQPERWTGSFWRIIGGPRHFMVMPDYVRAPAPGRYQDEVRFVSDGQVATLTIGLTVDADATSSPPVAPTSSRVSATVRRRPSTLRAADRDWLNAGLEMLAYACVGLSLVGTIILFFPAMAVLAALLVGSSPDGEVAIYAILWLVSVVVFTWSSSWMRNR